MKSKGSFFFLFFLQLIMMLFCSEVSYSQQFEIYVSAKNEQSGDGTFKKPLNSISEALEMQRKINKDCVIYLFAGEYSIDRSILIDSSHSNSSKKLTISNYKEDEVKISGGILINQSDEVTSKEKLLNSLTQEAKENIRVIDLKRYGIKYYGEDKTHGFKTIVTSPVEFFIGDSAMRVARFPNFEYLPIQRVTTNKEMPTSFYFAPSKQISWDAQNIWVKGIFSEGYADESIKVKELHRKTNEVTLINQPQYGIKPSIESNNQTNRDYSYRRFYFYNILEELDIPGEYYIDTIKQQLFYWPPDEQNGKRMYISLMTDPLLEIQGANNLTIDGITFANSRGLGLYAYNTNDVVIKNCKFLNMGTFAISLGNKLVDKVNYQNYDPPGGGLNKRFKITNCIIKNTGAGGVFLSGGDKTNLISANNTIEDTEISLYGRRNMFSAPAVFIQGVGNKVTHCLIKNGHGQAIMYWGNNHEISFTKFESVATEVNDQGAIYTGRDPSSTGTKIFQNFFSDVRNMKGYSVCAVYVDDGSGGINISNNVFLRSGSAGNIAMGAIHINGGGDNILSNNFFIDCERGVSMTEWDMSRWNNFLSRSDIRKRVLQATSDPYIKEYPFLKAFLKKDIGGARINVINNSVVSNVKEFTPGNRKSLQANGVYHVDNLEYILETNKPLSVNKVSGIDNLEKKVNESDKPGPELIDISKVGIRK